MRNKTIRFSDHQIERIMGFCEREGKSFSDAVRDLTLLALDEYTKTQSLGIARPSGVAKKSSLTEKQHLLLDTKAYFMLKQLVVKNLAEGITMEDMENNVEGAAIKYLNEKVYT